MWSTALPLYRKFCWRQSWSLQNLAVDATNSVSSSHWSGEVSVVVSLVWVPEEADGLCAVEVPAPECCSLVRKRWMKLSRSFTTPWLSYWYIYNVILSSSCLSWCKCELRHAVTSLLSSPWGLSGFFYLKGFHNCRAGGSSLSKGKLSAGRFLKNGADRTI